eukprot:TRINITY_DN8358_c0_g1_i1.p1 TRINITY_DN8358_c0_g1~~TRINITY_DN8358_c0_g1_i1.p1  ORF type:complete len:578 (+),score=134.89 TRINITY_DN8358_c0_g1_i1:75-1736(+)
MDGPHKLGQDVSCTFGDGGEETLAYPVVYDYGLPVRPETRAALCRGLDELAARRNDMQQNGVVEDIVDPDLGPTMLSAESVQAHLRRLKAELREDYDDDDDETGEIDLSEFWTLRAQYSWTPTVFMCDVRTHTASIKSDVHGLPPREQAPELYAGIEEVFGGMLGLLAGCLPERSLNGPLQVVVKAQRYRLPPQAQYGGQWHTEGFTENVVAAGVYYLEHPEVLSGGDLKFRPKGMADEGYKEYAYYTPHIAQGTKLRHSDGREMTSAGTRPLPGWRVVRPDPPCLMFSGTKLTDLSATVADIGICSESVVQLVPDEGVVPRAMEASGNTLPVFIDFQGRKFPVDMPGDGTVGLLLKLACDAVGGESRLLLSTPRPYPVARLRSDGYPATGEDAPAAVGDDDDDDVDSDHDKHGGGEAALLHMREGLGVAFRNEIPHRFTNIANATAKPVNRTFLNFFVIDREKPIPTDAARVGEAYEALLRDPDAKLMRNRARAAMTQMPQGWGWINYGNCGQIVYLHDTAFAQALRSGEYSRIERRTSESSGEPPITGPGY